MNSDAAGDVVLLVGEGESFRREFVVGLALTPDAEHINNLVS